MPMLGPSVSRWQLEVAALGDIVTWLETYLSDAERQIIGTTTAVIPRPPVPTLRLPSSQGVISTLSTSIHGALNLQGWNDADLMPEVMLALQPTGDPTYFGSGDFLQDYTLTLVTVIQEPDETLARLYADCYGSALYKLFLQVGDDQSRSQLGEYATRVRPISAPSTELVAVVADADDNPVAVQVESTASLTLTVYGTANDWDGVPEPVAGDTLPAPDPSLLPPAQGTAETVTIQVVGEGPSGDLTDVSFDTGIGPSSSQEPTDTLIPELDDIDATVSVGPE